MAMLIRLTGAKRALEIGTFTGYSTLAVAAALPEDGHLVACDISEEWTAIAQHYWREAGISHKIDLRLAPALTTLAGLKVESDADYFDFAFIDADKLNQLAYYEHSLRLVRPGGLITIDNVLWGGSVADPANQSEDTQAIRDFNKFIHQDQRVEITLVPIGDGLTLAWKKTPGHQGYRSLCAPNESLWYFFCSWERNRLTLEITKCLRSILRLQNALPFG